MKKMGYYLIIIFLMVFYPVLATGIRDAFLEEELYFFVADIYENYSGENFIYVYSKLHPALKEIISEQEYSEFQGENFSKYNLQIKKIKVQKSLIRETKLPDYCKGIISAEIRLYEVPIEYEMTFYVGGSRQKQEVKKEVFLAIEAGEIYLLWNPAMVSE